MLALLLGMLWLRSSIAFTGWNQFELDFYVSAPRMTALDGSHHRMTVFDNRQVPGDTVDFPAVCLFFLTTMNVHQEVEHRSV